MSNIRSLHGAEILPPGEPDPDVVKLAEETLERARSGDVNGIAVVMQHADDATTYQNCGNTTRATIGALEILKHELCTIGV